MGTMVLFTDRLFSLSVVPVSTMSTITSDSFKIGAISIGREIDIIKLNGSIELAPLLDLSDVIVDIVETGTTLKENNLSVLTEFLPISARLIANKASYKFKTEEINTIVTKFSEELKK